MIRDMARVGAAQEDRGVGESSIVTRQVQRPGLPDADRRPVGADDGSGRVAKETFHAFHLNELPLT